MIDTWAAQVAVFQALTAAPATYRVYDAVPQGVLFPYLVIGEHTAEPDAELALRSVDLSLNVHAWSRYAGKAEALALLEFVRARLDGVDLAGTWACTEDFVEVLEDRDSTEAARIYHGIARYRIRAHAGAAVPTPPLEGARLTAHAAFPGAATLSDSGVPAGYFVDHPAFPGYVTPDDAATAAEADAVPVLGGEGYVTLEPAP